MFSLIAVVCQSAICITFTPPTVYSSEADCMNDALLFYNVVKEDPNKKLIDITCYAWQDKA